MSEVLQLSLIFLTVQSGSGFRFLLLWIMIYFLVYCVSLIADDRPADLSKSNQLMNLLVSQFHSLFPSLLRELLCFRFSFFPFSFSSLNRQERLPINSLEPGKVNRACPSQHMRGPSPLTFGKPTLFLCSFPRLGTFIPCNLNPTSKPCSCYLGTLI